MTTKITLQKSRMDNQCRERIGRPRRKIEGEGASIYPEQNLKSTKLENTKLQLHKIVLFFKNITSIHERLEFKMNRSLQAIDMSK